MNKCNPLHLLSARLTRSLALLLLGALSILFSYRPVLAIDALAYSFETDLQGFHGNGGGTTITQDTIGATDGTQSMKVSIVGGATFVGAQSATLDPNIF